MSDEPITVFVTLNYWEIYRANVALLLRMFGISLAVLTLVLVVSVALYVAAPSAESLLNDGVFLLGCLLLAAFGFGPLLTARRVARDERVRQGTTYRFSSIGVKIETAVAKADLQWEAFRYAITTRSLLLLLTSKTGLGAQVLPIRCFGNEADLTAVRQLVSSKVPKTKLRFF